MFWNMLCFGGLPLKLYFSEWVSSPCGVTCKITLSLLWVEGVCEIKKRVGVYERPLQTTIIFRERWKLQKFICSAHRHSSKVWGAAGKVLIFKGKAPLFLEVFQCFVDSSPAEENSNGTRKVWSKNNNKDCPDYLQDSRAVAHRQYSGWIQSLEPDRYKVSSCLHICFIQK